MGKWFGVIERCLGRWEVKKDRERSRRNERNVTRTLFIEISISWWIERCQELSRNKKQEIAIERCPQQINFNGSRSYQAYRNFLDGSSSCRVALKIEYQESRWIKIVIISIKKGSSKGSIDSLAVERYREAVEIA